MKTYTIEIEHLVPNYIQVTVEAGSVAEAIEKAKAESDTRSDWRLDWENCRPNTATGAWEGPVAYTHTAVALPDPAP